MNNNHALQPPLAEERLNHAELLVNLQSLCNQNQASFSEQTALSGLRCAWGELTTSWSNHRLLSKTVDLRENPKTQTNIHATNLKNISHQIPAVVLVTFFNLPKVGQVGEHGISMTTDFRTTKPCGTAPPPHNKTLSHRKAHHLFTNCVHTFP